MVSGHKTPSFWYSHYCKQSFSLCEITWSDKEIAQLQTDIAEHKQRLTALTWLVNGCKNSTLSRTQRKLVVNTGQCCTTEVRSALHGHSHTARVASSLTSVSVADVDLPLADSKRVLGVTLDRRLTFDNHAAAVARSCNYHARAIHHIRHLLTLDLAQTLACRLILSTID